MKENEGKKVLTETQRIVIQQALNCLKQETTRRVAEASVKLIIDEEFYRQHVYMFELLMLRSKSHKVTLYDWALICGALGLEPQYLDCIWSRVSSRDVKVSDDFELDFVATSSLDLENVLRAKDLMNQLFELIETTGLMSEAIKAKTTRLFESYYNELPKFSRVVFSV